ncbi:metal ABC transporter permease [Thiomicrospira cyclica]|uniref:ABC-type transporter, integral membrane subunit n=1 Tax=Thiomicrospira cyclica (strain DSM 14477 / JCM 11371 / ALM1) TaxID=717773 RepID=F6DC54_THICA|nr:iron chelate uptake ABC transporter family permease subunit [Thiomicrospira cyclica]AEG31440.1 ABC-type transporter, integral membrane subunit [Thiomicrospira cyclica ALM1]
MSDMLVNANLIWVMLGTFLLGITAAAIGGLAVLRARALIGDVLAHAAIPGVMFGVILIGSLSPLLVVGFALLTGLIAYHLIHSLTLHTKLRSDTAMAIILATFFALGMLLLSYIQAQHWPNTAGLDRILFGQAAAITRAELIQLLVLSLVTLIYLIIFFPRLKLVLFNPSYAKSLGIHVAREEFIFALVLVMVVVVGMHIVGAILMAGALLIPITIMRLWPLGLGLMLSFAASLAAIAAVASSLLSLWVEQSPTGPWMIVILGLFFMLSWLAHQLYQRLNPTSRHV